MKVAKIQFSYESLIYWFKSLGEIHLKLIKNPLPTDAKVIRTINDDNSQTIWVVIESDKFDNVGEAEEIPIIDGPIFEIMAK